MLLDKLRYICFNDDQYSRLIANYFNGCKGLKSTVNYSTLREIRVSLPQSSILGLLLYLIWLYNWNTVM